jgi:hypothetical protein
MEELIFALLCGIAEVLAEMFSEVVLGAIVDLMVRSTRNLVAESKPIGPVLAAVGYLSLGSGLGLLSIFLLPHSLIPRSRFHGVSLLVSPVLTGLVMSQVGRFLRRQGKESVQIESFGYGFTFDLGVAMIRFIFVS